MPYQYDQWAAAGLGAAPTYDIPTARPPANIPTGQLVPLKPPAILTRSKPVNVVTVHPARVPHKPAVLKPVARIDRYQRTDTLTRRPLAVAPTGVIDRRAEITNIYSKPVVQPAEPAKPAAILTTTASGSAAIILPANTPPGPNTGTPAAEIIPTPTNATTTQAGAGTLPQVQSWTKIGLLAVGAYILMDAFKPKKSVRLKRSR